jgi:hypothetical protein
MYSTRDLFEIIKTEYETEYSRGERPLLSDIIGRVYKKHEYLVDFKRASLDRYFRRNYTDPYRHHQNQVCTDEEELEVICTIKLLEGSNITTYGQTVVQIVKQLTGKSVSIGYVHEMLDRHRPDISIAPVTHIKIERKSPSLVASMQLFCKKYKEALSDLGISPNGLLNLDCSKPSFQATTKDRRFAAVSNGKEKRRIGVTSSAESATVCAVVNAVGETICVIIVLKADGQMNQNGEVEAHIPLPQPLDAIHDLRSSDIQAPVIYAVSKSGALDRDLFISLIPKISDAFHQKYPDLQALLILDRAKIQDCPESVLEFQRRGFHTLFLPPDSTTMAQPDDQWVFAELKKWFRLATVENATFAKVMGLTGRQIVLPSIMDALPRALDSKVITASWRDCFLWPFDEKKLMESARRWTNRDYERVVQKRNDKIWDTANSITHEGMNHVTGRLMRRPLVTVDMKPKTPAFGWEIVDKYTEKMEEMQAAENAKKEKVIQRKKRQADEALKASERAEKKKRRLEQKLQAEDEHRKRVENASKCCRFCSKPIIRAPNAHVCKRCTTYKVCHKCYSTGKKRNLNEHQKRCNK